jgi:TetR/AcrR family transcriptional regulator, cholesterol catabolism regulator
MTNRTLVISRTLSDEQAGRRDQVVAAAMALAESGGYDAVVMKAVADRSGVALATLYRWFASKDHLLTEVLLAWGGELSGTLAADPPRTGDAADRVAATLGRVMEVAGSRPRLAGAVVAAVLSVDSGSLDPQGEFHEMVAGWIGIALGEADVPERAAVIAVLEHVCFSTIIGLATGRQTVDHATGELTTAARLLLRDAR